MSLTKIGSIGINTGIKFAGVTTITTLNSATDTLTIGGPVSIAGTLTYEDVTNVDSVGLITARNGVVVGSGITLSKDGDIFFTGVSTGNGSGLTALNATQLTSGTVPDARFPATLPAASGANLTALNATQLTSGTIPDARFPAVLPAISGANLTNLPISDRISQDNSAVQVVDSGSTGFVKIDLENTERLRVASLGQIGLSGQNYGNAGEVITSQGSSSSPTWASPHRQIQDLQGTTSQINDDAYTELNITGYKAYSLFKIETSHESWVRVYVDDASRDADTTRSEGQDPAAGSGLIAEVRTSGAQTVLVTPGAFGFNNDNPRTNNIYLSVVNRSGSPQAITVTLTAIQIGE